MSFKVVVPRPDRLRHIPPGFGWVDHRFVRLGCITGLSRDAQALYLFLITVANESGLSWYSDEKLCARSGLSAAGLDLARAELAARLLIAYARPIYQVLELPCVRDSLNQGRVSEPPPAQHPAQHPAQPVSDAQYRRFEQPLSIAEIMGHMAGGGRT
ncbi:MAG: helix-turn-helix domain-containing protein [Candidatus Cloacimonetes bacterium]|nr:helix-turn-helix domain-containing protein [Candidatus Cloacimonadota bacterium]MDY0368192.1 hypothetical protein [Candidatus Syntrophosphaera sp.]